MPTFARVVAQFGADTTRFTDAVDRSAASMDAAVTRIDAALAKMSASTATHSATAAKSLNAFQQAAQNITSGIQAAVGFGLALAGVNGILDITRKTLDLVGDSIIGQNSKIQDATTTFIAFTGSVATANAIVADLRQNANITPFRTEDVITSGRALINAARGSREELMLLVGTAEKLAALVPEQGLRGAAFSLSEAMAGQYRSIRERFRISLQEIQAYQSQGMTALEAINAALEKRGGATLVEQLSRTWTGLSTTIGSFFDMVRQRAGQGIFNQIAEQALHFVQVLDLSNQQGFGQRLLQQAQQMGAVLGALFQRLSAQIARLGVNFLNMLQPGLGDRFAKEWEEASQRAGKAAEEAQAQAAQRAAEQAAKAGESVKRAFTLADAEAQFQAIGMDLQRLGGLSSQVEMAMKPIQERLDAIKVQSTGVQIEADRTRLSYDQQLAPLERQLRNIQSRRNEALELSRLQMESEAAENTLADAGLRRLQAQQALVDARLNEIRAQQEGIVLDSSIARMRERLGANIDPNAPGLTTRQRLLALELQAMEAQRESNRLGQQISPIAQAAQARDLELQNRKEVADAQQRIFDVGKQIESLHPEIQAGLLKNEETNAVALLDIQLRQYKLRSDTLQLELDQWKNLDDRIKLAIAEAQTMAPIQPKVDPVDEANAKALNDQMNKIGQEMADHLQKAFGIWVEQHFGPDTGPTFKHLGTVLGEAMASTFLPAFISGIGTAIDDALTERFGEPGSLGRNILKRLGIDFRAGAREPQGPPTLVPVPDEPGVYTRQPPAITKPGAVEPQVGPPGGARLSPEEVNPPPPNPEVAPPPRLLPQGEAAPPPTTTRLLPQGQAATAEAPPEVAPPAPAAVAPSPPSPPLTGIAALEARDQGGPLTARQRLEQVSVELPDDLRQMIQARLRAVGDAGAEAFVQALRAGNQEAAQAALGLGASAVDAISQQLGVASPSRVFRRIGQDTAAGFIQGFRSTDDDVRTAIEESLRRATDAAEMTIRPIIAPEVQPTLLPPESATPTPTPTPTPFLTAPQMVLPTPAEPVLAATQPAPPEATPTMAVGGAITITATANVASGAVVLPGGGDGATREETEESLHTMLNGALRSWAQTRVDVHSRASANTQGARRVQ
jgi:hypothetical protein